MLKTGIYIAGLLALANTDLQSDSLLHSQILPLADMAFVVFIASDLASYLAVIGSSAGQGNIFSLLRDIFYLNDDIREFGLLTAVSELVFTVLEFVLLISAMVYALNTLLNSIL